MVRTIESTVIHQHYYPGDKNMQKFDYKKRSHLLTLVFFFIVSMCIEIIDDRDIYTNEDSYIIIRPLVSSAHYPIFINGNDGLDDFCSGNGTDGSEMNPYIIENYEINANNFAYGIKLVNISKYLVINDCIIIESGFSLSGKAIELINCSNIEISDCSFYNSSYGIYSDKSGYNQFIDNDIFENSNDGLYLTESFNTSILNNTVINGSIGIALRNSDNNTISGNNASYHISGGIHLYYSNGNTISNNNASFNELDGIQLRNSNNNRVFDNFVDKYGRECISDSLGENNSIFNNYCGDPANYFPHYVPGYPIYLILPISIIVIVVTVRKLKKCSKQLI